MLCTRYLHRTHSTPLQTRLCSATSYQAIKARPDEEGMRLDRWLRNRLKLPQSLLEKHLRKKDVSVATVSSLPPKDWAKVQSNTRIQPGQFILLSNTLEDKKEAPTPEKEVPPELVETIRSWLIYKDKHIIILNKPNKVAVQGSADSLASMLGALKFDYPEKPSTIHRLDKETSGILVLARTKNIARDLSEAWRKHEVKKLYWAILVGRFEKRGGMIRAPLTRKMKKVGEETEVEKVYLADPKSNEPSEEAVTKYKVIEKLGNFDSGYFTFIALMPLTGRTHQLRVHCASVLKCPILGDGKYGSPAPESIRSLREEESFKGLQLHAREILFTHPVTKKEMHIKAQPPEHMQNAIESLGLVGVAKSQEATLKS